MKNWMRIAHRGASGHAPENTFAAFRLALEIGTDAVEMDVHLTRDGEAVILHDATLERTTDKAGAVAELTAAEVRRADAGIRFSEKYRGERVPTLPEALELISRQTLVVLEIKAAAATLPVVRIVREMDRIDQVMVISFLPEVLKTLRWYEPRIPTSLLIGKPLVEEDAAANAREMLRMAQSVGTSALTVYWRLATPEAIWEIHRRGGTAGAWVVNDPAEMTPLMDADVDALISDYPDRLNDALGRR